MKHNPTNSMLCPASVAGCLLSMLRPTLCSSIATACLLAPAHAALVFDPPNPVEGSMVRISGLTGCRGNPVNVTVIHTNPVTGQEPAQGRRIEIADPGWIAPPLLPCPPNSVTVGPLLQGSYEVRSTVYGTAAPAQTLLVGAASTRPPFGGNPDHTGFWMHSDGLTGLSLQRDPGSGRMFAVWFTHTLANWLLTNTDYKTPSAIWMYAPNLLYSAGFPEKLTADLYLARSTGPVLPGEAQAYPPAPITAVTDKVGTFSFEPQQSGSAIVTIQLAPDAVWRSTFSFLFPNSSGRELRFTVTRYRF